LFCGDFNLPDVSWSNDNYRLSYTSVSGPKIHCVPEIFALHNFFQLNSVPNSSGNILDLVFSNNPNMCISKSDTLVVPCDSYHSALDLIFTFDLKLPLIDNSHNFFDFRKGCYTQICLFLTSNNWLLTITSLDIDSATHAFYDALHYCVLNFVLEVKYKPSRFPNWFSKDLNTIAWGKKKKHAKYKSTQCPRDFSDFSALRAQYKIEYKKCHNEFLSRTENQLKKIHVLFGTSYASISLALESLIQSSTMIYQVLGLSQFPIFSHRTLNQFIYQIPKIITTSSLLFSINIYLATAYFLLRMLNLVSLL